MVMVDQEQDAKTRCHTVDALVATFGNTRDRNNYVIKIKRLVASTRLLDAFLLPR